jgi:hypothetical protein
MHKLASRFSHLDPTHVTFVTAPIANANYRATSSVYGYQPQDNVELDPVAMAALFASFETDATASASAAPTPPPNVLVQVDNGTGRSGLARTTATQLQALGFHIGTVGDAASTPVTTISYDQGDLAAAQLLQSHVPQAALVPSTTVGIVLTLGTNFTTISAAPAVVSAPPVSAPVLTCAP